MNALQNYFNESLHELRQVRWPTRQQAIRLSIIVIGFTLVCSLIFGLIDFALAKIVQFLISLV